MDGHAVSGSGSGKKKKIKMCEATSLTDLDRGVDGSSKNKIVMDTGHSHSHGHGHPHGGSERDHKRRATSTGMSDNHHVPKQNQVGNVLLFGVPIVSLVMDGKERLCLAQISSTLLKEFSYNEIHNRRVALGITCIQCTPVQLEILRRAGAMPVTSRRCGMITRREAERLCQSFLGDHAPPQLPENFAFEVYHECAWGCRGAFVPSRYNSSRAKCIRCSFCQLFFSPNKFIFHSHRLPDSRYVQPDAANFNSWRRHLKLCGDPPEEVSPSSSPGLFPKLPVPAPVSTAHPTLSSLSKDAAAASGLMATSQIVHAWEDVKAMFNGGTRKRLLAAHSIPSSSSHMHRSSHNNSHNNSSSNSQQRSSNNNHGKSGPISNSSGNSTPVSMNNSNNLRAVTPQSSASSAASSRLGHQGQGQGHPYNMGSGSGNGGHSYMDHLASPPSFMNVPSPLLSPSTPRLDTIWNPGISSAAAAAAAAISRQCQQLGVSTNNSSTSSALAVPPLPFHPLSIPWLRRPLFPFSHPFGPSCKLFGETNNSSPGGSVTASNGNNGSTSNSSNNQTGAGSGLLSQESAAVGSKNAQNLSSAFKPVVTARGGAEQLLSWMNNNNNINIHNIDGLLHTTSMSMAALPEDLSLSSACLPGSPADISPITAQNQNLSQNQSIYNLHSSIHAINNNSNIISEHPDPLIMSNKHLPHPLPAHLTHLSGETIHSQSQNHSNQAGQDQMMSNSSGHNQHKKYTSHLIQQVISSGGNNDRNNNEDTDDDDENDEDEENVDIESTEVEVDAEECCSSTSNNNNNNNRSCSTTPTLWTNNGNQNRNHGHKGSHVIIPNSNPRTNKRTRPASPPPPTDSAGEEDDEIADGHHNCSSAESESDVELNCDSNIQNYNQNQNQNQQNAERVHMNQNLNNAAGRNSRRQAGRERDGSSGSGGGGGGKRKRLWDCDKRVVHIKSSTSGRRKMDKNGKNGNNFGGEIVDHGSNISSEYLEAQRASSHSQGHPRQTSSSRSNSTTPELLSLTD